jgi:hypothetical protein
MNKINFKHLILLVAILFVLNFFINKNTTLKRIIKGIMNREKFDNLIEDIPLDKKNKSCSQESINYSVNDYIFAKTLFARP